MPGSGNWTCSRPKSHRAFPGAGLDPTGSGRAARHSAPSVACGCSLLSSSLGEYRVLCTSSGWSLLSSCLIEYRRQCASSGWSLSSRAVLLSQRVSETVYKFWLVSVCPGCPLISESIGDSVQVLAGLRVSETVYKFWLVSARGVLLPHRVSDTVYKFWLVREYRVQCTSSG